MTEDGRRLFGTLEATREAWGLGPLPPSHGALLVAGWSRSLAFAEDDEPAPFATILQGNESRLTRHWPQYLGEIFRVPSGALAAPLDR